MFFRPKLGKLSDLKLGKLSEVKMGTLSDLNMGRLSDLKMGILSDLKMGRLSNLKMERLSGLEIGSLSCCFLFSGAEIIRFGVFRCMNVKIVFFVVWKLFVWGVRYNKLLVKCTQILLCFLVYISGSCVIY